MNHFLQHIMAESICLRVTVQQAKYQALTMYQTIGRDFLAHPHFAWHLVENIAPGELAMFQASIATVNTNSYNGYSKDLDAVKSANFRHLGYLAKELMVNYNNETHLNDNQVFSNKPPRYAVMDKLLKMYGDSVAAEGGQTLLGGPGIPTHVYRQPLHGIAALIATAVNGLVEQFSI